MSKYSSKELQEISSNFRLVARRLSRTDYSQCDANLKRFMSYIKETDLISNFISENNIKEYDIKSILESRGYLQPFEVSHIMTEEISLQYQLLEYAIENLDGNFTRLYGTHWYTGAKSTVNDEMHKFIEHIIDPLIDFIAEYLKKEYEKMPNEDKNITIPNLSATNSTVVFNSNVSGNIETTVNISNETKDSAQEIIDEMIGLITSSTVQDSDDILEILKSIDESIKSNEQPKKSFLTALKALCSGTASIAGLATALIKLLTV